jgi:hypothetical protein
MGDFFRDYGTQLALAIAAINTIITIIIGQYFKDSPIARIVFVIVSAALIVLGVGASFYSQYQISMAANAEKAHSVMIREGIGRYIGEGSAIMNRFGLNEKPMPTMDEVAWVGRTEDFLRTKLCESYVIRFHDNSGLAPISANDADSAHNSQYAIMFHEIARLE